MMRGQEARDRCGAHEADAREEMAYRGEEREDARADGVASPLAARAVRRDGERLAACEQRGKQSKQCGEERSNTKVRCGDELVPRIG